MLLAGRRITMTTRGFPSARFSRRQAIGLLGLGAGLGFVEARGDAQTQTIPRGAIIRTILKDLPPDGVGTGAALMHEHLTAGGNVDVVVDELKASGQQGLSCIVDAATGRREEAALEKLRTIATRSGVHVVVAGGYFQDLDNLQTPYPPQVAQMTVDQIAEQFARDANAQRWGALGEIGTSNTMRPE